MAAALPVVGSVAGGLISSSGAKSAAKTQAAGQQAAINAQMDMFNKTQENLKPYMQTGGYANTALSQLMGLGPNGGYDQGAYQNALNTYNAGHPSTNTNNSNAFVISTTQRLGPGDPGGYLLSDGRTISQAEMQAYKMSQGENQPGGYLASPGDVYSGNGGSSNGSVTSTNGNSSSASGAPQLTDFPLANGGPLNSPLLKPITMDQATLEKTPGYQFNLKQGLKSTQNAAAARGLGSSGAALKGAASFATGLADNTYQNQFNNAVTNQQNQYNRLFDVTNLGANAAAGLGGIGQKTGENLASTYVGGANAQAGSQIASSNALGSGLQSGFNQLGAGGLYGNSGGGGTSGYGWNSYDPAAASSGLPWSDRRLKENIIPLGYENGHKMYEFNYIGHAKKYIGVMAQDLVAKVPMAVHKINGFFAVDYSKLGVKFREA